MFAAEVYIDGVHASGPLLWPGQIGIHAGVYLNEQVLRPFTFTGLEVTGEVHSRFVCSDVHLLRVIDDDRTLAETRKIMNNLGVIEVRFHRASYIGDVASPAANIRLVEQPVHEKSKKAGYHRVSYVPSRALFLGIG